MVNKKEKSIEEMIQEFKEYHGEKSHYITGGWTISPGKPDEKHVPRKIVRGPLRWSRCKLCNESYQRHQPPDRQGVGDRHRTDGDSSRGSC